MTEGYIKGTFSIDLSCEVGKEMTDEELNKIAEDVVDIMNDFEEFYNVDIELDSYESFSIEATYESIGKYWNIPATWDSPPEGGCDYDLPVFDKMLAKLKEKYKDFKFSIDYDENPVDEDVLDADYFFDEDAYRDWDDD